MGAGAAGSPGQAVVDRSPFLAGIVEVEEGEVNGQELRIASHSIARISFAKEPHVEQVSRPARPAAPLARLRAVLFGTGGIAPRFLTDRFVVEPCLAPCPSLPARARAGAPWLSRLALGWRQRGAQLYCFCITNILVHLYCPPLHTHPYLSDKFLSVELLDQRIGTFKILVDNS